MAAFALIVILFPGVSFARHLINQDCGSTFCGNLNISFPFRLENQPLQCGWHVLELECENNNRTTLVVRGGRLSVQQIFYKNYTIRVVDASLDTDNCNSLPLSFVNYHLHYSDGDYGFHLDFSSSDVVYVVNCMEPIKSSLYIEASRCTIKFKTSSSLPTSHFYFLNANTHLSDINQTCTIKAEVLIMVDNITGMSTLDIYRKLLEGFWIEFNRYCYGYHFLVLLPTFVDLSTQSTNILQYFLVFEVVIISRALLGILCLFGLIFKKKMTKNFKDKLGEGGYGSVFKGKLRSGHHVAVKLLDKSKGNEFFDFGIKPHNILLDENYNSKVFDFDLAKLYSIDDSIVSLTTAQGTIGYIALELVYKNLGGISYKADVYSFGMLLMEMVGRRKNVNAFTNHTSQIYFPSWIYERLDQEGDMELRDVSNNGKAIVKKMIITTFWRIQLLPFNRPSMNKVVARKRVKE
ncbi:hypothetical protein V6Z12_D01G042600 [Gossypium hirsutum]